MPTYPVVNQKTGEKGIIQEIKKNPSNEGFLGD